MSRPADEEAEVGNQKPEIRSDCLRGYLIMNAFLTYLLNRLKEPSTWASLAAGLMALHNPTITAALGDVTPYLVAAAAALGAGLPEGKSQ